MSGVIATIPKYQFSATDGTPLVAGTLTTYLAGTTTLSNTWQDSALTSANTNPITLDSRGECVLWLDDTKVYKFVLKDAAGVTQWTADNITNTAVAVNTLRTDLAAPSGSSLVGYISSGTGAVSSSIQTKLREWASIKDFGAVGDASTDDTAAFNLAIAALNAGQIQSLHLPAGTYRIISALTTITKDGVSIYGDGPRLSILSQRSNVDTLTFSNATPATTRINDIFLSNFGIDYGSVTAPTAGRALSLIRVARTYISNLDIRSVFQGVEIQGGSDTHIANITISGAFSWSAVASGSFLMRFAQHSGSLEIPSEWFITNFNIKGTGTYGGTDTYLSNAIIIQACDGVFFDTGHLGFSFNSNLFISPQAVASASVQNLEFSNVYSDGNNSGSTSNSGVLLSGSTVPVVGHIKFDGCSFKNYKGNGLNFNQANLTDLRIVASEVVSNGSYGLVVTACQNIIISDSNFSQNNGNNSSADCIALTGVVGGVINGNQLLSGAFTHLNGLNISSTCSDLVVSNNVAGTHTTDYGCSSTTRIQFSGNRKIGSDPTVVAVDGLVLPLGYDVVTVTGNTNFSNIGGTIVPGNKVTLRFTGTPTTFDSAGNIKLAGNFVATADSTLTIMGINSTTYTEVSRAVV